MTTSKMTSVNTTKMPAIYKKIDWFAYEGKKIVDIGCGRPETQELIRNYLSWWKIEYIPYDPNWNSSKQNIYAFDTLNRHEASAIVCTNVLNVIQSDTIFNDLINNITHWTFDNSYFGMYYGKCDTYISVYEGNKSGVGCITKKDCYQRNQLTKYYLDLLNKEVGLVIPNWKTKYGIISNNIENLHK